MSIIITVDDFGMSKGINAAILTGIEKGIITSTNVMVNMPWSHEAKAIVETQRDCDVGIHLNITSGKPVSDKDTVLSLVDENGCFYAYPIFKKRLRQKKISKSEVKRELEAQIAKYRNTIGEPDYWNTHNHVHMLPELFKIFIDTARRHELFVMRNNYKYPLTKKCHKPYVKNLLISFCMYYAKFNKMKYPSGMALFRDLKEKTNISTYLDSPIQYDKQIEVILHIADEVDSKFFGNLTQQRIIEKQFLFSTEFQRYLETVSKCSFRDLV